METTYTTFTTMQHLSQSEIEKCPLLADITIQHGKYVPERYGITLGKEKVYLKREDVRRFAEAVLKMDDRINEVVKVQDDADKFMAVIVANSNLNRKETV